MLSRSERFDRAVIEGSARVVVQCDAYRNGKVLLSSADLAPAITAGTVTLDLDAETRRALTMTVVDEKRQWTRDANSPLTPFGTELHPRVGFTWADGTTETVPVGVFRITDVQAGSNGETHITAADRSVVIRDGKFEAPWVITGGTTVTKAISDILVNRIPGLAFGGLDVTTTTVPDTIYEEGDRSGDPWRIVRDLAAAEGRELFFGVDGQPYKRLRPTPWTAPVWNYEPDHRNMILGTTNGYSLAEVHNVWVVIGEPTDGSAPVRAQVEVASGESPIHPGRVGRRPRFYSSPLITTLAQAVAAAEGFRAREAGWSESMTMTAIPHPAHEPGDVVRVVDPEFGIDVVVMSSWTLDLFLAAPADIRMAGRMVW